MFIVCCKTTMHFFFLSKKGELKGLMVWPACSLAKHCSHPLFRPLWCVIFYANVIHQEGLICPRASAGAHFLSPGICFLPTSGSVVQTRCQFSSDVGTLSLFFPPGLLFLCIYLFPSMQNTERFRLIFLLKT